MKKNCRDKYKTKKASAAEYATFRTFAATAVRERKTAIIVFAVTIVRI